MRLGSFALILVIGPGGCVPPASQPAGAEPDAGVTIDRSRLDSIPEGTAAPPTESEPPCPRAPCAARPVILVHGFSGSNRNWDPLLDRLLREDGRFDGFVEAGVHDHAAWPARSVERRRWLFVFDYYLARGTDAPLSYSAGPGRIGSNRAHQCLAPPGAGRIVATSSTYSTVPREYAAELGSLIESVRRATGAQSVDLVGHSMGGLIARSYWACFGGASRIERALLIASPIYGTAASLWAQLFPLLERPDWTVTGELAELDSGDSPLSPVTFLACEQAHDLPGAFGSKLLLLELAAPTLPEIRGLSGAKDLIVSYLGAKHPLAISHQEIPEVDHMGILASEAVFAAVRDTAGARWSSPP